MVTPSRNSDRQPLLHEWATLLPPALTAGRPRCSASVAGDDVIDVVDMRGVVRGASGFQDAQAEVVVDPAVGEQENVLARCCGTGSGEGVGALHGREQEGEGSAGGYGLGDGDRFGDDAVRRA